MDNGHDWKLKKKRSDTSLHHYFFSERVKNWWNSLQNSIVCATSVNSFKSHLQCVWNKDKFLFEWSTCDCTKDQDKFVPGLHPIISRGQSGMGGLIQWVSREYGLVCQSTKMEEAIDMPFGVWTCSAMFCSLWGTAHNHVTCRLLGIEAVCFVALLSLQRIIIISFWRCRQCLQWFDSLQCFDAVGWAPGKASGLWKNWVVGCWCGYLSGVRCRLAYGPANATATHCLLLQ